MSTPSQDLLDGIENRRTQLQINVEKLQQALAHWATWEAEYDALREEIQAANDPSPAQMREIAHNFRGLLINEAEVLELLGKPPQGLRSANQVVEMIARRIDYVQLNGSTVEKQLEIAEKRLAGADVLLEPGVENEEGLPMMDIEEELDDAGNEISSSVTQTGKGATELIAVLRKAGLHKDHSGALMTQDRPAETTSLPISAADTQDSMVSNRDDATPRTVDPAASSSVSMKPSRSISSTEDAVRELSSTEETQVEESGIVQTKIVAEKPSEAVLKKHSPSESLTSEDIRVAAETNELHQEDKKDFLYAVPEGENQEDAELRRQMLQYSLSEVGQIVAELDLDQPTASFSDDNCDDDFDDYDTEDEEDEDEYGRSTRSVITDDYRQQMRELERRLDARMLENVGPQPCANSLAEHVADIRTMRVRRDDEFDDNMKVPASETKQTISGKKDQKKGVRFADHVHVSQARTVDPNVQAASSAILSPVSVTSNLVVERSASPSSSSPDCLKPPQISKFPPDEPGVVASSYISPDSVNTTGQPISKGPIGCALANTVTEHIPVGSKPQPPDEFDPEMMHREIQAQYHKARNKFIGRQGGFNLTEMDQDSPIVEEQGGKTKRVSRFKAARLKADDM